MQLKDVTPIIKAILDERNKIPLMINTERYIPNWQPNLNGNAMRGGIRKALRIIEQAPVVEAVPVRHGRWEKVQVWKDNPQTTLMCSLCKTQQPIYEHEEWKFCPFCGIPMDAQGMDVPIKDGGATDGV